MKLLKRLLRGKRDVFDPVAQLVEQLTFNQWVGRSSRPGITILMETFSCVFTCVVRPVELGRCSLCLYRLKKKGLIPNINVQENLWRPHYTLISRMGLAFKLQRRKPKRPPYGVYFCHYSILTPLREGLSLAIFIKQSRAFDKKTLDFICRCGI